VTFPLADVRFSNNLGRAGLAGSGEKIVTQESSPSIRGTVEAAPSRDVDNSGAGLPPRAARGPKRSKKPAPRSSGGVVLRVQTIAGRKASEGDVAAKAQALAAEHNLEIVSHKDTTRHGFLIRAIFCVPTGCGRG
jgi:hypothetical protein